MLIETKEQYEKIPDGTRLRVILAGDNWGEDTGFSIECLKLDDKLYDTPHSFYLFSEKDEKTSTDDYTFLVIKTPGKEYEI